MMDRSAWRRPHGFPDLPAGEVHVWRAWLDGVSRADGVMDGLSADERARAERFVFERDRRRFAVARSILRARVLSSGVIPCSSYHASGLR